jgi:protein ImuB
VVGLVLEAEPGTTSKVQMGLFSPQLPEAMKLDVTLARIKAIVGEECVGRPVLKNTHRPDGFGVEPFVVTAGAGAVKSAGDVERAPAAVRQVRPAERVLMLLRGTQPAGFTFRDVRYEVERAYGPWVMSGDWWNPTLWGMEQWDLIARGGDGAVVCCCVVLDGIEQTWKMVGLYD